jgi:glycosyltransferase involved in cell wall biosynthesis
MTKHLSVALVVPDLHIGGVERLLVETIAAWQQQGEPITPYVYAFRDGPVRDELEAKGCLVFLAPTQHRINPLITLWLVRSFRDHHVQLAHLHLPRAGFYGRLAAGILHLPVLYTEHSLWENHGALSRLLNKSTYFFNTHAVAVSDAVMTSIRRHSHYPTSRLTRIHNGILPSHDLTPAHRIDLRQDLGLPRDALIVGTIANIHPRKGLTYLLHAVSDLLKEFPALHWVTIGRDDGAWHTLQHLATHLGIAHHVHWLGYRSDARRLLAAFDIFVLPSLFEGLSIALIEAMDAGLPIVTTRVGGNPELIMHGQTGLLVEPGEVEELTRAIRILLTDPGASRRMGTAAQVRMRTEFTTTRMAKKYADLYRTLVHCEAKTAT